eukprot:TRINITY_DN3177_c0_g1_i1.p1 TRINITY_DN3177_c0_g1~~TRINITY_DN3177_c0_g1_i1.p1  ORF type:complete len:359 (+),score=72.71 TRINITY_DN3177_c0_g1_i1:25-1101(+)
MPSGVATMISLDVAENMSPRTPPGTPPGTPTRRKSPGAIFRRQSTGKLEEPARARRRLASSRQLLAGASVSEHRQASSAAMSRAEATAREPVASMPSDTGLAISSAVDTMWLRCAGDDKYWAQIRYAHALLVNSIGSEIAMDEAVSRSESVLGPIFQDAIAAQEADRLNAVEMLAVLRELVTRCNGETAMAVRAAAAPLRKRSRIEDESDTEEFQGDDERPSGSAAAAGPSHVMAAPTSPAFPQPRTPTLQAGVASFGTPPCTPHCESGESAGMPASSSAPQTNPASADSTPPITPLRPRRISKGQLPVDKITPEAPRRKSVSVLASCEQEASSKDEDPSASSRKRMRLPIQPAEVRP